MGKTESLARSFFEADIALIISGISAFEAASVGTPALYIFGTKEQKSVAEAFEKEGMGIKISNIDEFLNSDVIGIINSLSLEQRQKMGNRGKELIDGLGVYRVIDFLKNKGII